MIVFATEEMDVWRQSFLPVNEQLDFPIVSERSQQQSGLWEKSYRRGCQETFLPLPPDAVEFLAFRPPRGLPCVWIAFSGGAPRPIADIPMISLTRSVVDAIRSLKLASRAGWQSANQGPI